MFALRIAKPGDDDMPMILAGEIVLSCTHGGELLPWIGPAFRGVVARRLKDRVCRQPQAERETRWAHCKGCPFLNSCIYGSAFETQASSELAPRFGSDGARAITLSPEFPVGPYLNRNDTLRIIIKWIDPLPDAWPLLLAAITHAMAEEGIGPDHVRFNIDSTSTTKMTLDAAALPTTLSADAHILNNITISLGSPLVLNTRDDSGRRASLQHPRFADLFRASVRTLRQLFAISGQTLEIDWPALNAAAERIPTIHANYQPFRQHKWSNRTLQGFDVHAVTGSAAFADIPAPLIPWIQWGGFLHVGTHRVAGAGAWRLSM